MIVDCVIEMYKIAYVCACELAPKNSEYIFQNTPRSFLYKKNFGVKWAMNWIKSIM